MIAVETVFQKLLAAHGEQFWWPAESDFEMLIGAILVQNTNWSNVEKALAGLEAELNPEAIREMPTEELALKIRPSGYYNQKALKIKAFVAWQGEWEDDIHAIRQQPLAKLRAELLNIKGIGPETADCMLAYAFRKPVMVIDAYSRRLFARIGYEVPKKYEAFQQMLETGLPDDLLILQEFHALIVEHCKQYCQKTPKCLACPLKRECKQYI
ncbi:HhH-GPD family protein [Listeria grandensis FSL F6-0971]|uniref:HhH-GPD family protein n=1 Tax=Listeria grandensis FSL F6-0971 TaxID=1265819 RepID=W7B5I6_9LIST|nr:endonuclease III domain-containing protein [Listeria grandensis]EUJ22569.1 HhH-GPD family protein [Listeria grandensis FSL F6-0971]